jgi:kinesin family protein 18/19
MIANIGPSNLCYEDTHNTLKYANRAKNIKTSVTRNVLNVEYHVSKYTEIIAKLKGEIVDLKS